jgi:hypothetical protein
MLQLYIWVSGMQVTKQSRTPSNVEAIIFKTQPLDMTEDDEVLSVPKVTSDKRY